MKQCPECRSPIASIMLLESRTELEYYCERCNHGWAIRPTTAGQRRGEPALV